MIAGIPSFLGPRFTSPIVIFVRVLPIPPSLHAFVLFCPLALRAVIVIVVTSVAPATFVASPAVSNTVRRTSAERAV